MTVTDDDLEIPPFLRRSNQPKEEPMNDQTPNEPEQSPPPMGHNSGAPVLVGSTKAQLMAFVHRVERLQEEKDALSNDMKQVYAEAKATGFDTPAIRRIIRERKMKPHERAEREAIDGVYLHAAGLATEPPLHQAMRAAMLDDATQEALIEGFKKFVPANGEIIINTGGGTAKRLWRDHEEEVHVEDWDAPKPPEAPGTGPTTLKVNKGDVPNCSEEEAVELGRKYYRDNLPIVANPFPYGDTRRGKFDDGYCQASGTDGMGAEEPDEEPNDDDAGIGPDPAAASHIDPADDNPALAPGGELQDDDLLEDEHHDDGFVNEDDQD